METEGERHVRIYSRVGASKGSTSRVRPKGTGHHLNGPSWMSTAPTHTQRGGTCRQAEGNVPSPLESQTGPHARVLSPAGRSGGLGQQAPAMGQPCYLASEPQHRSSQPVGFGALRFHTHPTTCTRSTLAGVSEQKQRGAQRRLAGFFREKHLAPAAASAAPLVLPVKTNRRAFQAPLMS